MRLFLLAIIFSGLSACSEQPVKNTVLIPVEERNVPLPEDQTFDNEKRGVETEKKRVTNRPQQSVIVALLDDADAHTKTGQTDKAAATIERALRIEPKNALLWQRLALIKLQQQQWQQAIVLARKSNALAANDHELQSVNWGIIADAYVKLGDKQKADEARKKQRLQG